MFIVCAVSNLTICTDIVPASLSMRSAICGDVMTIPGLPTRPGFYDVDIDTATGRVIGLF